MSFFDKFNMTKRNNQAFDVLYDAMKAARKQQLGAGDLLGPSFLGYSQSGYLGSGLSYYALVSSYKSWVYTCTTKIANSVAMLPLKLIVYRNSTGRKICGSEIKSRLRPIEKQHEKRAWLKANGLKQEEIFEHPFLDLMKRPNHIDTRFVLWFNMILRLELTGTAGIYIVSDGLGIPRELWILPLTKSGVLKPMPDSRDMISGFAYEDSGRTTKFTRDEILFLRYPDPASPFEGMSALKAQLYPYDIDTFLEKQQYYLLKNRAVFGNVFSTDQNLKQNQIDSLKELLSAQYQGAANSGNPLVLHSGLKLGDTKLGATLADLMVKDVEQFAQDKLLSAYGTPAGKLGLVKDVNRANMEALDDTYFGDCIKPKTMMIEEEFETFVLPRYDEALTMDFDLPKRNERDIDIRERATNLKNYYTTINEEREKEGKEPVSWGNRPWGTIMQVPIGSLDAQDTVWAQRDVDTLSEPSVEKSYSVKAGLTREFWTAERKSIEWKAYVANHSQWEKMFQSVLRDYFAGQKQRVKDHLFTSYPSIHRALIAFNKAKVRQVLARMCEKKDMDEQIGLDKKKEQALLIDATDQVYKAILQMAGQRRMDFLSGNIKAVDLGFEYNVNNEDVLKWLGDRLERFSEEVTNTSFDEIKKIMREGFQEGKPVTTIANDLSERFESWDKYRAPLIARTETTGASNFADLDSVEQAGLEDQLNKCWLPAGDGNERDTHAAAGEKYADGIPLHDNFQVGSDSMQAPGTGSEAGENINCRCTLYYQEK
jgi:HK97 family phage portal protein